MPDRLTRAGALGLLLALVAAWGMTVAVLGMADMTERQGRHWSQAELYECELDPECDEAAAAQEMRLWRSSEGNSTWRLPVGVVVLLLSVAGLVALSVWMPLNDGKKVRVGSRRRS